MEIQAVPPLVQMLLCGRQKMVVSEHPRVCTHDQHFEIRPSDLNLRLRSAQKAAGGFVSGEKLLGMSEAKKKPSRSHLQTSAEAHDKDRDSPAELMFTKHPYYKIVSNVFGGLAATSR